jgi:hypothetical protein
MAKTKYVEADMTVHALVDSIMNTWPDRFMHVQRNDLLIIMKDAPKSSYKAKTKVMNGFYRMLTKKKIVIEIHKQEWDLSKPADRVLMLYRELWRIDLNAKTGDYKLIRPDLTDFTAILDKVGLHKETVDTYFIKIIKPEEK